MKRISGGTFLLLIGSLVFEIAGLRAAAQGPYVGMDVKPPERYSSEEQKKILDEMHTAGVKLVRAWIVNDSSYEFIRYANSLGMSIELTVPIEYRTDAVKRAAVKDAPNMYPSFPLSAADPALTATAFEAQLTRLESMKVTLVAFEVGNEQNNAGFNGDFQIFSASDPGVRKNFSLQDLKTNPDAQPIVAGYRQYLKVLSAVKAVRDRSTLNRSTPLMLGGLADTGEEKAWPGAKASAVSINASIQFLRELGLDKIVDAYGIHTYPWKNGPGQPGPAANRRSRLENYALSECRTGSQGKPCWVTEWGFQNPDLTCPSNESERSVLVRELMGDFRPYVQQKRVVGLLYYVWTKDEFAKQEDPYSIFRCGVLSESGRIALDASLLR